MKSISRSSAMQNQRLFYILYNTFFVTIRSCSSCWDSALDHISIVLPYKVFSVRFQPFIYEARSFFFIFQLNKLKYILFLSHAWGEVVAMLALYTKFEASEFETKLIVPQPSDLSYMHGYLEKKQWAKLHMKVVKHGDPGLRYVWVCIESVILPQRS